MHSMNTTRGQIRSRAVFLGGWLALSVATQPTTAEPPCSDLHYGGCQPLECLELARELLRLDRRSDAYARKRERYRRRCDSRSSGHGSSRGEARRLQETQDQGNSGSDGRSENTDHRAGTDPACADSNLPSDRNSTDSLAARCPPAETSEEARAQSEADSSGTDRPAEQVSRESFPEPRAPDQGDSSRTDGLVAGRVSPESAPELGAPTEADPDPPEGEIRSLDPTVGRHRPEEYTGPSPGELPYRSPPSPFTPLRTPPPSQSICHLPADTEAHVAGWRWRSCEQIADDRVVIHVCGPDPRQPGLGALCPRNPGRSAHCRRELELMIPGLDKVVALRGEARVLAFVPLFGDLHPENPLEMLAALVPGTDTLIPSQALWSSLDSEDRDVRDTGVVLGFADSDEVLVLGRGFDHPRIAKVTASRLVLPCHCQRVSQEEVAANRLAALRVELLARYPSLRLLGEVQEGSADWLGECAVYEPAGGDAEVVCYQTRYRFDEQDARPASVRAFRPFAADWFDEAAEKELLARLLAGDFGRRERRLVNELLTVDGDTASVLLAIEGMPGGSAGAFLIAQSEGLVHIDALGERTPLSLRSSRLLQDLLTRATDSATVARRIQREATALLLREPRSILMAVDLERGFCHLSHGTAAELFCHRRGAGGLETWRPLDQSVLGRVSRKDLQRLAADLRRWSRDESAVPAQRARFFTALLDELLQQEETEIFDAFVQGNRYAALLVSSSVIEEWLVRPLVDFVWLGPETKELRPLTLEVFANTPGQRRAAFTAVYDHHREALSAELTRVRQSDLPVRLAVGPARSGALRLAVETRGRRLRLFGEDGAWNADLDCMLRHARVYAALLARQPVMGVRDLLEQLLTPFEWDPWGAGDADLGIRVYQLAQRTDCQE